MKARNLKAGIRIAGNLVIAVSIIATTVVVYFINGSFRVFDPDFEIEIDTLEDWRDK